MNEMCANTAVKYLAMYFALNDECFFILRSVVAVIPTSLTKQCTVKIKLGKMTPRSYLPS